MQRAVQIGEYLRKACRNLVDYAGVREGDQVVILVDEYTDDLAYTTALQEECEKEGAADVYVVKVRRPPSIFADPGPFLAEGMKKADVIFVMCGYMIYTQPAGLVANHEYGAKIIRVDLKHPQQLNSEFGAFPVELLFSIVHKTSEIVTRGKKLRVTTDKGTDLTVGINPFAISGSFFPYALPGERTSFPGGMVGINPQDPANGVLVFEAIFPSWQPPDVILKKPLIITIEDRVATKIEGEHADWVEELIRTKGDENSRILCEVMWGNHPKGYPLGYPDVPAFDWFMPFHYRPDLLHCALGRGIADFPPYSKIHLDFYMFNASVYVDGEPIIERGRHLIFEDPEVRRIAAKYGDPDELLRVVDIPEGVRPKF